jgi:imidazolonepropionase
MQEKTFLVTNISQLLLCHSDEGNPLRGKAQNHLDVLANAALLVKNGLIGDFGDNEQLKKLYSDLPMLDAENCLLMPGMIDPHTHLVFAGTREDEFLSRIQGEDYLSNLSKGKGIHHTVELTRKAEKADLYRQAKNNLYQMLKHGTTSCEAKSGYGLDFDSEIKALEINRDLSKDFDMLIPSTLLSAHALPGEYINRPEEYLAFIAREVLPVVAEKNLADFIDVFCEKNAFDAKQALWILEQGQKYGLKPKIHTEEFFSIGGIEVAVSVHALSADHLMQVSSEGINRLADSEVIGVVLPGTAFNMKQEDLSYPRRLIDGKVPLAIGTDFNPGTCMCYSMQIMMELAVLKMGLSIQEAINASTVNASFACGLNEKVGSIEKGKRADLLILSIENFRQIPYFWGINKVKKVILNGRELDFQDE